MWFTGYAGAPEETAERFTEDRAWYLTGDAVRRGERADHPPARDGDAVIGLPDALRGAVLDALVVR
jgi:acetyl-CoA synthetase